MSRLFATICVLLCTGIVISVAQGTLCSPEREAILELVSESCLSTRINEVCYGNSLIESEISAGNFSDSGDTIPVNDLQSLQTIDGSPDSQDWGVAIFNIQANLPGTLPGQVVTMIVFGDASLENEVGEVPSPAISAISTGNLNIRSASTRSSASTGNLSNGEAVNLIGRNEAGDWVYFSGNGRSGWLFASLLQIEGDINSLTVVDDDIDTGGFAPMQAFTLRTGIGALECQNVADTGLLVQTPAGEEVTLFINSFEVRIGSTALFLAEDTNELNVSTFEGVVTVQSDTGEIVIPEGFTGTVRSGEESTPAEIVREIPETLPLSLLPVSVPQNREPITEANGFLQCSRDGGMDVPAGSTVVLRGGWAESELSDLLSFVAGYRPIMEYNGVALSPDYRAGPTEWRNGDQTGYQINWYWEFSGIRAGIYTADWIVGDQRVSCEIRAS